MSYYTAATPLTAAAQTGNNTHAAVNADPESRMECFQFVVEAIGATPTVTWQVQGSVDGVAFFPLLYITDASDAPVVAAITVAAVGKQIIWLSNADARFYKQYRLVTSANTNVTYHGELYEAPGTDA